MMQMLKTNCVVSKEMLKKASAGAAGQYIGGSRGVVGTRGWHHDIIPYFVLDSIPELQ